MSRHIGNVIATSIPCRSTTYFDNPTKGLTMKRKILLLAGLLALAGCTAPEPAPVEDGPVLIVECEDRPELCTYDDGKPK
jgi:hypothetical protein